MSESHCDRDRWPLGGVPPQNPRQVLNAGPVTAEFEPDTGFLRYVRLGPSELLRGVYAAVRDPNWGTVAPELRDLTTRIDPDRFDLQFVADCRAGDIDFVWQGRVQGDPDGTITYRFSGTARSEFRSNRIGFCVLHPVEHLPGRPCRIEHADGTMTTGVFPEHIAPHQPFRAIRAITHQVQSGVQVEVRMTGDTFEMEDQRNWTDASYKTYCRPLELPFPFVVAAGERIEQTVQIRLIGTPQIAAMAPIDHHVTLSLLDPERLLPAIGIGQAAGAMVLSPPEAEGLRRLHLAHLRADLHLQHRPLAATLQRADREAAAIGADLELALHLSDAAEDELCTLVAERALLRSRIARFLIFHVSEKSTSARWGQTARRCLRPAFSDVPIGLGTDAFFAELNRARPAAEDADFITYSVNPQVHAADESSIVESLAAQTMTVSSAQAFSGGLPVVVSPITLRMRFNPNATDSKPAGPSAFVDPRQASLFAAAWTLGSIRAMAEGGATSVTFYETTGERGVLDGAAGVVYPVFHVLADVGEWAGGGFQSIRSSHPLAVQGIVLRRAASRRLMLANLQPQPQHARWVNLPSNRRYRARSLDAGSVVRATRAPCDFRAETTITVASSAGGQLALELPPYAVLTLDEEET